MAKYEPTKERISLHGLGFVQVPLGGDDNRRLHVWHPDLPRRRCFEASSIHDHRFGFLSAVLVGVQINTIYRLSLPTDDGVVATHVPYLHEGPRTKFGNRPWLPQPEVVVTEHHKSETPAGGVYSMEAYVFHSTTPGGDGRVATIMTKSPAGERGARSLCRVNVEPDADFDRKQWDDARLWSIVREVLEG